MKRQPNIQAFENPPEWKYVERLIPLPTIPQVTPKAEYPSGWKPPSEQALTYPYHIRRNKSHMVPVYLKISRRNMNKQTLVKNIKGDIWALNRDITEYVEDYMQNKIRTRVNEFVGHIKINGDYMNLVKDYLIRKGF